MTFVQLYPSYREIYLFEPSESSFSDSRINLSGHQRISFFQKGLWDKSEILSFDDSLGNASRLSKSGGKSIQTVTLESVIRNKVDFIKLDIEGAEHKALMGAKELICRFRPFLAICVYHNQDDFVRIPELVLSYDPTYKVYLRHYSQGVLETVMYFI
jgi:FkbM family methyltransferase